MASTSQFVAPWPWLSQRLTGQMARWLRPMSSHERGFHDLDEQQIDSLDLKRGALSTALVNRPSARHQRAADRSIEDCACKATSARLMWAGGAMYGWWVTLHILDSAIVHAIASYAGGGHWVAGQGMLPESNRRHGLMLADGA